MTVSRPILLSGYDAKRCARRIHNEWDLTIDKAEWEVPASVQMRFDAGVAFEAAVFDELRTALDASRYVDLSEVSAKGACVEATVQAMGDGVEVVLGGWLPDDVGGGRKGRPDILLRSVDGYVPGDVKGHRMIARRPKGTLTYSRPAAPAETTKEDGFAAETTARLDDYLQLAHYWRMLETTGHAPSGPAKGFIIGSDFMPELGGGHVLSWVDLAEPFFQTYSRSRGTAKRSALERYDHEQGFRRKIAAAAVAGEAALVQPIFTDECDSCPWLDHCRGVAGDATASGHITAGRLSIREWAALADAGVVTIEELAEIDTSDPKLHASYLPEVTHLKDPMTRLAGAVRRARMIRDGRNLERETTDAIAVPRADVEIDFDIEWDPEDRVYLWGALVNKQGADPTYHPIVSWDVLDDHGAGALAAEFADWLREQIAAADRSGQSLLVYHYAHPEPTYLKRLLGETKVADLLSRFVDLLPIIREHYFGLNGLGIKRVAPEFGFRWRDDDPGGLQSQLWLLEARAAEDDAVREAGQRRILAYNEDDVRATAAIRNGL